MRRRLLCLLCVMLMVTAVLSGCGGGGGDSEKTYNFKLSIQYPEDHNDTKSVMRACEAIKEKTNGAVNIKVYPSNQLGDYTQVYEEVMKGTIDMATLTVPTQYDARLEMLTIPYLVTNYEEAKKVFAEGSHFYTQLEGIQQSLGVHTLNIYLDGFMGIGATKPIENVMDFSNAHTQLLRVPAMDSYIWTAKAMGFNTTTIPYADLYSALQTGVADGWIGGSAYVNYTSFRDVLKYFADNRYIHELIVTVINADTFKGLPEEYQQIIADTFAEEAVVVADQREELDAQAMKDMKDMGIEIYVPSQEELDAMAAMFRETVWPKYKDILGEDLLNGLIEEAQS